MFLSPVDDYEREQAFHLAEQLDLQLTQMENSLNQLISNFNQKNISSSANGGSGMCVTGAGGGVGGSLGKMVDILNEHHTVLAWLDTKSRQLNKELQLVNRELSGYTTYEQ